MFGARALILKGVELWSPRPRLLRLSRPQTFATRESSTTSLPANSLSTTVVSTASSSTPVPDCGILEHRSTRRYRLAFRYVVSRERLSARRRVISPHHVSRARHPARPQLSSRPGYRRFSPLRAIYQFLCHHESDQGIQLSPSTYPAVQAIARDRSNRPTMLLAQAVLRRLVKTGEIEPGWASGLETWDQFDARLETQRVGFITSEHLSHWAWILTTKDRDLRVHRFGLSALKKPYLLFDYILKVDRRDLSKESLIVLVGYLAKWDASKSKNTGEQGTHFDTQSKLFTSSVVHLVKRCLAIWPPLLTTLAQLTADYIKTIPLEASTDRTTHGYKCRCEVFNSVVQALGTDARANRQRAREFCWQAQRILLECSSTCEPQLIISRPGYRSIRTVLLGLKKTPMESKVALRSSTSNITPPYRETWDGTDERRKLEDDLSRASKAGILMHEAGYDSTWIDEALTALGGSFPGRPPTIQTKTLDFEFRDTPDTLWTARMCATRNAREAWRVFQTPPVAGMLPTINVYAVMFAKLHALPVDMPGVVPGDNTRAFPVNNMNLSPFSISLLEAPGPKALYLQMLKQGLSPTGECLKVLIRTATSIGQALSYFRDSPYWKSAGVLKRSLGSLSDIEWLKLSSPKLKTMRNMAQTIPGGVLVAWIEVLCRFHISGRPDRPCYIKGAFFLAKLYHVGCSGPKKAEAMFLRIAEVLARGKKIPTVRGVFHGSVSSLRLFLAVFSEFKALERRANELIFKYFCGVFHKAMWSLVYYPRAKAQWPDQRLGRGLRERLWRMYSTLLLDCRRGIVHEFNILIQPPNLDTISRKDALPQAQFPIAGAHTIMFYMRALAVSGNSEEMVRLVDWIFDSYERGDVFPDDLLTPGTNQYRVLVSALSYFDTIICRMADAGVQERLRGRLDFLQKERGCTWFVSEPGTELLREYLRHDLVCGKMYSELTSHRSSPSSPPVGRP